MNIPFVTEEDLENLIVKQEYHVFGGTTTTVCCLVLRNGFTVVGTSACINPENFDHQTGMNLAREDAKDKIWQFAGYVIKEQDYVAKLNSEREVVK